MQGVNEWTLSCPLSRQSWSTHREHGYSEQISADSSHYYREYLNVSCQYNPWISTSWVIITTSTGSLKSWVFGDVNTRDDQTGCGFFSGYIKAMHLLNVQLCWRWLLDSSAASCALLPFIVLILLLIKLHQGISFSSSLSLMWPHWYQMSPFQLILCDLQKVKNKITVRYSFSFITSGLE